MFPVDKAVGNDEKKVRGGMDGFFSHYLIRKRVEAVKPFLQDKKRILDIGSGLFKFNSLLAADCSYIGVDIEQDIVEYNRKHFSYRFEQINVETDSLSKCGTDIDLVLMLAVIEHFNEPEVVLGKIGKMLGSKGIIVLTTPHPVGAGVMDIGSKLGFFTKDKHTHHLLFNHDQLQKLAARAGLLLIKYKRFLGGVNQLAVLRKNI